jgi:hypothetical protein
MSMHDQWCPRCQSYVSKANLSYKLRSEYLVCIVNLRIAPLGYPSIGAWIDLGTSDFGRLIQGETIGATACLSRVAATWSIAVRDRGICAARRKTGAAVALGIVLCSSIREAQSEAVIRAFFVSHVSISGGRRTNRPSNIAICSDQHICKLRVCQEKQEERLTCSILDTPSHCPTKLAQ